MKTNRIGVAYGVSAYVIWGSLPIYWRWLDRASAYEIMANRGIWSLVVCLFFLAFQKQLRSTFKLIRNVKTFFILLTSSFLLTLNWGIYIWAVSVDRVVEASLGYYMTPLVVVCFGVLVLKEKLRFVQKLSLSFAGVGVSILTIAFGQLPLVAFGLALSWGTYSLIKKRLDAGSLETLSIEMIFALIPSATYMFYLMSRNEAQYGSELWFSLILMTSGLVTVIPLLMFNSAATSLPLTITGLLGYINPTIMFLVGFIVFHEPLTFSKIFGFIFIWTALILLGIDMYRSGRSVNQSKS
ncbi:chloramphenicol-sensitive protein RarD [Candidatus Nanopelagicus limnes]|uniref:Chloramphenicol-sensitive protein RarD n=1 Tax=Candidatus Nanopelagicus limnae TaxID=1884634 RepID=A0A249JWI8_9ACTN|nr:EamA family transporter RarD [Candidatus Nanopelagicus limnes]ASY08885.1 chloramphenicol-sensitive protein RarD [Candidatus Nanopelagicus limnes]